MGVSLVVSQKIAARVRLDAALGRERGYVYFQDFVPNNRYDTRITIIGDRAFGFTRDVRPGDFRASGSGRVVQGMARVLPACVESAFAVARQVRSQSLAIDYLIDASGTPCIAEVSYGFDSKPVYDVGGYWSPDMVWHAGGVWPEHAILQDILADLACKRSLVREEAHG